MKRLALALVLALSVSGCATLGGVPGSGGSDIGNIIRQVQDTTRRLCGFVPVAATISGIFAGTGLADALSVATAICNAVSPTVIAQADARSAFASAGPVTVRVRGVTIKGHFVKRNNGKAVKKI